MWLRTGDNKLTIVLDVPCGDFIDAYGCVCVFVRCDPFDVYSTKSIIVVGPFVHDRFHSSWIFTVTISKFMN